MTRSKEISATQTTCACLRELIAAVYETLYRYNAKHIPSALRMPPSAFARLKARVRMNSFVSNIILKK
jgi:hypothetical protein